MNKYFTYANVNGTEAITLSTVWESVREYLLTAGMRLVEGILLIVIGFILVGWITKTIKHGKLFSKMDANAKSFIIGFVAFALKVILVFTAAAVMGVPMTSIVALIGSCGLAIGLSLQGSLANLAGGLVMLIFRPFSVGDYIETSVGEGTVTRITVLYTHLLCLDETTVIIPNGTLANTNIKNCTSSELRRASITVGVAYGTDIKLAKRALLTVAKNSPYALAEPQAYVDLDEYGDSAIVFTLHVWIKSKDYWYDMPKIREAIKAQFEIDGIKIPFPQLDIHMDGMGA